MAVRGLNKNNVGGIFFKKKVTKEGEKALIRDSRVNTCLFIFRSNDRASYILFQSFSNIQRFLED